MNDFLITVIIPCYNHEKYLMECIESINNQKYRNFQWIIVDDGSKDSCPKILKENKEKYNYDLILQNNKGLAQTLTETIRFHAKGKYICLCASDDFWVPEKLEIQIDFMEKNPEYAMCYGKTYFIDSNSKRLNFENNANFKGGYIFEDIILQRFHPPVNYMVKKEVLEEMGYYKSGIIGEDFYMNCLIANKYKIGFIPEYLGYYRLVRIEAKRDPYASLKCLRNSIDIFKEHPIYNKAVLLSNFRTANMLVYYSKYKFKSLQYLIKSIKNYKCIDLARYFFHFLMVWK
jgi:alpha-1,3-rhamnosyltransferase